MTLGSQSYRYASYVARGGVRCKRRHGMALHCIDYAYIEVKSYTWKYAMDVVYEVKFYFLKCVSKVICEVIFV